MSKYLVIIESPGKLKKIKSILGKEYEVLASFGHVRDLPPEGLNVNIKKEFEPKYEIIKGKEKVVKDIIEKAKKMEIIYLFTDQDREGAAIASHICECLPKNLKTKRAKSGSITHDEILNAIHNATEMSEEQPMINSYECRRILDRLVGYKCSFVTKQATGGTSAGRVQSASLRIIAEREKEIKVFVPQEYWPIDVELEKFTGERFWASIKDPNKLDIISKEEADKICNILKTKSIKVLQYETKEASTKSYPPFTTSTLYQSGSSILGWSTEKTASVAQKLYENSLCTYIRSDSTFIVPEFINSIRETIPSKYGDNYLPSSVNVFVNKKSAQEAHEAIRMIDILAENPTSGDDQKLYEIVWKRTMASQVSNMIQKKGHAEFKCEKYILSANGSKVIFDGWRKVWDYGDLEDTELPELKIGETLKMINIKSEQKFTQPPSRYTESSLVKELENLGIGRPSTYATIIKTLLARTYIEKSGKTLSATDMGISVSDFLIKVGFCFIDLQFTASLENKLDQIANQEVNKLEVLTEFWERLKSDLENAKEKKDDDSRSDFDCPECNKQGIEAKLIKKHSRFGAFYACSRRKEGCEYKADVATDGTPKEKEKKTVELSDIKCKNCGEKMIIRTSKKGNQYLGCKNWASDTLCTGFFDLEGNLMKFENKKKYYKKKKN